MTYRTSVDIDAPIDLVWEILTNVEQWPGWLPTVSTVERLEPGMFRAGSNARIKQPRLKEAIWHVTSLTPHKIFTWTSRTSGVATVARHMVSTLECGGTRAESDLKQSGPLSWIARIFYGRLTRSYLEQEAQGLKKHCETQEALRRGRQGE